MSFFGKCEKNEIGSESAQNEIWRRSRVQKWSPWAKESKNFIFRPISADFRPEFIDLCDSNFGEFRPEFGRKWPENKKFGFWDSSPSFCTVSRPRISFCGDFKRIYILVKNRIFKIPTKICKNRQNLKNFLTTFFWPRGLGGCSTAKPRRVGHMWVHIGPRRTVVHHQTHSGPLSGCKFQNGRFGPFFGPKIGSTGYLDNFFSNEIFFS